METQNLGEFDLQPGTSGTNTRFSDNERRARGTTPWITRKPDLNTKRLHTMAQERYHTVFFLGGSRVQCLATHARMVFHSPLNTSSPKSYEVVELGHIGLRPNRETARE